MSIYVVDNNDTLPSPPNRPPPPAPLITNSKQMHFNSDVEYPNDGNMEDRNMESDEELSRFALSRPMLNESPHHHLKRSSLSSISQLSISASENNESDSISEFSISSLTLSGSQSPTSSLHKVFFIKYVNL